MARYTFEVEIAGVETLEADAFAAILRSNGCVVSVEHIDDSADVPLFRPFEVYPKRLDSGDLQGWLISTRDDSEEDSRRRHTPFMCGEHDESSYQWAVDECKGELDPTKLRSEDLTEYTHACYQWARLCLRSTGCDMKGFFKTREDAEKALPLMEWAVRNPGKSMPPEIVSPEGVDKGD